MARTKTIKVGTVIPVEVTRPDILASVPCDKGNCMLTLAGARTLIERFGKANYKVRSTNHGMMFDIGGYRVLTVFDHQTARRIYNYDEIYRKTRSAEKARASVRAFRAKLMVESCQKAPTPIPMTEAKKAELAQYPKNNRKVGINNVSKRRQLSL